MATLDLVIHPGGGVLDAGEGRLIKAGFQETAQGEVNGQDGKDLFVEGAEGCIQEQGMPIFCENGDLFFDLIKG